MTEIKEPLIVALDELEEEGDFRYIRQCENCQKIYFAGRLFYRGKIVLAACGDKCSHALHNRRLKAKQKDKKKKTNKRLGKEILASIQRALSGWLMRYGKPFQRNEKNVRELAEDQEITTKKCEAVLDLLKVT